jgi:dienelactone hydrolase
MTGMERPPPRPPDREELRDGLAYALWLPDRMGSADEAERGAPSRPLPQPPWPGIVIAHGAGSRKENHADFARLAAATGWVALSFDARGHGASEGEMSSGAIDDVVRMAQLLAAHEGVDPHRVAVRGSSMGGFLAIHAAAKAPEIAGVIAICPAGEEHLRRGLKRGELEMRVADHDALDAWLSEHDVREAVEMIGPRPLILLHAEGDESIPASFSQELYARKVEPCELILIPGGDHRSVQHDAELQLTALRWLERRLG